MKSTRDPSAWIKDIHGHPIPKWEPPKHKKPAYWNVGRVLGWAAACIGVAFMVGAWL